MKFFAKILTFIILLGILLFIGFSVYVKLKGKEILSLKLSQAVQRSITVDEVSLVPPLHVRVRNFMVDGKRLAQGTILDVDLISLFVRKVEATRLVLIKPVLHIQKTGEKKFVVLEYAFLKIPEISAHPIPPAAPSTAPEEKPGGKESNTRPLTFVINQLIIEDGQLSFEDQSSASPLHVDFADVDGIVRDISFPFASRRNAFEVSALLTETSFSFSNSRVGGKGWVDVVKKDMDADIQLVEPNGNVGFSAKLKSRDNALNVKGNIQLNDLGSKIQKSVESSSGSLNDFISGALRSSGIQIAADFNFDTKMDDFQIGSVSFSGNVGFQSQKKAPAPDNAAAPQP